MSNRAARAMIALSIAVVVATIAMWANWLRVSVGQALVSHALGAVSGILGASILAFGEEDRDSTCLVGFAAGFACVALVLFDVTLVHSLGC